ncbi:MAG: NAD-dependent epimerase/dehydratase family protein [Polaribacter sp.]|uniref:NAD-dependent epimerase/dehydratase family protein n=1 Tax=Polaribacter sp. TaxID=1920175 RepID=UPI003BAF563D
MIKKILVTGHSGFLGAYIKDYLESVGYEIIKLGRSKDSDIVCDISKDIFSAANIEAVIHVAGKAHSIPKTEKEKEEFFKVNTQGSKNVLQSIATTNIKSFIFISTVAVYGKETGQLIDENEGLLGNTPYALSKIQAEKLVVEFGKTNNCKVVILRLPLITGQNPVGNLQSMINAIQKGYYFRIGVGEAKRSIISAVDVAKVIPELLNIHGIYNYTDCTHPTIAQIDTVIAKKYNKKIKKLPKSLLKWIAKVGDSIPFFPFNSSKFEKLTNTLTFSNKKILQQIKFKPINGLTDI